MAIPSYEESVAALQSAPPTSQSPSLYSRAGQQLANAPSNIINDLFRLYYNLGASPRASEPVEVPKPYDIPAPQSFGESAVDLGANLAESLPWFLTGEGAGVGLARLAEAGPLATNIAKLSGGFALQGLTESKEQAAESGALGAGFGAVEKVPGIRNRLLASFLLGGGSAALAKLHGADNTQAGIAGATNVLLPFFGGFAKEGFHPVARESDAADYPAALRSGPGYRENIGLTAPEPPVQGPDLAPGYNRAIGLREIPGTGQPPATFKLNGEVAPEGSLIRDPIYTEGEAAQLAQTRKAATERLMPTRTEPTVEQPFLNMGPPEGSLIREPTYSPGEISNFMARRPVENGKVVAFPKVEPDGLVVDGSTEPARPPVPPTPPIPPRAPFAPEPPRPPQIESPKPEPEVATLQPESAANAKTPSVKLKDVVSPDNEAHAHAAAEKLGMEYQGVGMGSLMEFKFKNDADHAAAGANISFRAGGTYKDLKNQAQKKIKAFEEGDKKAAALKESKVATLQQKAAGPEPGSAKASQSLSSLESKPTTVPQEDLPHGLAVGDKAIGHIPDFDNLDKDTPTIGTIRPTVEPGTIRFEDSNGDVYDLHPSKISGVSIDKPEGPIKSVGGMSDVEKATYKDSAEDIALPGGGTKKRSTFGRGGIDRPSEQANISHEAMFAMARYVVAPALGATVGAATGNKDDAWSRAVIGAIIGGAAGALGGKAFKALLENPSKAAKAATTKFEAFKAEVKTVGKVATASEKLAAEAASDWPGAGALDKMARWMNKNLATNMVMAKLLDRAHGKVEYLAQMMSLAVDGLKNHKDIKDPKILDALDKYFRGDSTMSFATLQRVVPTEIADLAALADKTRTNLQDILVKGLAGTRLGNQIQNSIGEYLTTTYKIFHDPKYTPTDTQIADAVKSMSGMFESFDVGMKEIREYIHEIKTNRRMFGMIGGGKGEALGSILARTETGLTKEFKQMLGIYENPVERIGFTGMKLVNGAKSAEFFNEVAGARKANGLKYSYTRREWDRTVATLQQQAGHDPVAAAKLQELQTYVYNSGGNSNGQLSNMIMDVKTRDQLANYDAASRMFQSPVANAIAQITNRIKYGKIILSPLQLSRQIIQLPILGMISKTGPAQWMDTFRILRQRSLPVGNAGRAEYDRLLQLGVLSGDPVGGMFRKDMQAMLDGSLDSKLTQRLGKAAHNWEEIWRTPDLIIRASAFLKKEGELLDQGHKASDAVEQALDHMNRYTMNYGAVPPIVAKGRQLPFINQYLSWTYETLRLTKNLMEDAKGGDVYAMGVLSTIGTIPFIIQAATESQLSPEDRKAWEQTKALSPDWSRGNFKFVVNRNADGSFRYIDYTPLVVHDQFFRMMKGILSGDKDLTLSANPVFGWENTPLLNVAKIAMSSKDNYGRPTDTLMEKMEATRREVLPTLLGTELDRVKRAVTPNDQGGYGITDKRSGTVNSITDILQTYVTSMRPYTVKPEFLKRQAIAETMDQIRQQQSLLRKTLSTNASEEVKADARKQFQAARDEILKGFRDKLGISADQMTAGQ